MVFCNSHIIRAAIERQSSKNYFKLNDGKCNYVAMNVEAHRHDEDGTSMKEVDCATYLGGDINITTRRAE